MKPAPLLLLLASCSWFRPTEDPANTGSPAPTPEPERAEPAPEAPEATPAVALPAGFELRGDPVVEEAYLGPSGAWRQLRSRLTTLQADARRAGRDVLVSFEPSAVHVTRQDGSRVTWRLPVGLALTVEVHHVLVRADLTLEAFAADGTQIPSEEELTVALATLTEDGTGTREFRLVVKGGSAFRSMTSG